MYLANVMKAGDYLTPVPVGLPITLQYNFSGNLEIVYLRFGNDRIDVTSELMDTLRKYHTVPAIVHLKKGITTVRGVLYTAEMMYDSGHLPYCVEASLKAKFLKNPSQFNFFAATWDSSEGVVQGPTPIKQMLNMSKFKSLPGWLVPTGMNREILRRFVTYPSYTFNPDMLTNYIIFRGDQVIYHSTQMKQFVVSKVVKYTDEAGFIKARVYASNPIDDRFGSFISVDYPEVVKWDIQTDTLIVLDAVNQIILSRQTTDKKRQKRSNQLACTQCNKAFTVPKEGQVSCPDLHCVSHLIPHIKQFIAVSNLPSLEVDTLSELVSSKKLTCVPDIFTLPGYRDVSIDMTLSDILRSLVPFIYIPRVDAMKLFAGACNNNIERFSYYCNNPEAIVSDLGISHPDIPKLTAWLGDNYNLADISSLLSAPQIVVAKQDKKFDGVPMFRGKSIFLTGKFIRGSLADIGSILSSYSATILYTFNDTADCIIVGSMLEDIDGESVQRARSLGIAVFEEDSFFLKYEIDADIATNLQ